MQDEQYGHRCQTVHWISRPNTTKNARAVLAKHLFYFTIQAASLKAMHILETALQKSQGCATQ